VSIKPVSYKKITIKTSFFPKRFTIIVLIILIILG